MKARAQRLSSEIGATSLSQAAKSVAAATLGDLGGVPLKDPEKAFDHNNDDEGEDYLLGVDAEDAGTEGKSSRRQSRGRTPSMVCVVS